MRCLISLQTFLRNTLSIGTVLFLALMMSSGCHFFSKKKDKAPEKNIAPEDSTQILPSENKAIEAIEMVNGVNPDLILPEEVTSGTYGISEVACYFAGTSDNIRGLFVHSLSKIGDFKTTTKLLLLLIGALWIVLKKHFISRRN